MSTTSRDTQALAGKFCEALRRGGHKQAFGSYRDAEGGVDAVEVLRETAKKASRQEVYEDPVVLPIVGPYVHDGRNRGLTGLNDFDRLTFPQIADVVSNKFSEVKK
jgi:hypothetical protein